MMKKSALFGFILLATATPALVHAEPAPTIQSERAAHPNLVHALEAMKAALADMERAPHDFGGNKVQAMADTRQAIHSLKRALYYRLKLDDAALDKAE